MNFETKYLLLSLHDNDNISFNAYWCVNAFPYFVKACYGMKI